MIAEVVKPLLLFVGVYLFCVPDDSERDYARLLLLLFADSLAGHWIGKALGTLLGGPSLSYHLFAMPFLGFYNAI